MKAERATNNNAALPEPPGGLSTSSRRTGLPVILTLTLLQSTSSAISPPLPTQCFFDTVLVPLPTWLLLVLLALLPLFFRSPLASRPSPPRRWVRVIFLALYYFCIGVIILMESIEIARLARASLGIGLLPFVYAGCLVAAAGQATDGLRGTFRGWQAACLLFWVLGLCISAVKTAALTRFGTDGPLARDDSAYPVEDQVTDLAILIVFYGLLAVLEAALLFVRPRYRAEPKAGGALEK